jgi:hypothetical protein
MPPESPEPAPSERAADWEAFYRDYRKPGYVPGFEITTKLGGGMSGLVFRARKQSIGKDYAIKFLQVDDPEVRRAVLAELAQVEHFAQIDHPNLVSIEDRGEVDGIPYLVMAFAGTETLRDHMPTDGVPPAPAAREQLLRWFLQCCRGLAALHERSLVHFDIKPANVFLKGGVARLGDYGLSKLVTQSRGSLSTGRGTPYYMAPELLQRRGDHRSDVYSLGVMLYELLCGRLPFRGDSEWEVLRQHEATAPELPGHLSPLERAVLQRCLQKDPAARFQGVHDLIAAFGGVPGVGAAAWQEVRAGLGDAPPPLPKVLPPPLPDDQSWPSQLAGVAQRQARRLADQAVAAAAQVVRATDASVREAMQGMRGNRGRSAPHRRAMARLHRRWHRRQREPGSPPAPSGRWGRALTLVGAAVMVAVSIAFVLALFLPVRMTEAVAEPGSGWPTSFPSPDQNRRSTFADFRVPEAYRDLVSVSEPSWVVLAERDLAAAARLLEAHLARLSAAASRPGEPGAPARLPQFGGLRELSPAEQAAIDGTLDRLLAAAEFDPGLADELAAMGPAALARAAERLGAIRYQGADDVERARRLHLSLQRAIGARGLAFVADRATLREVADANRQLGALWLWLVNEVAHTDRTWQAFRRLRGGG